MRSIDRKSGPRFSAKRRKHFWLMVFCPVSQQRMLVRNLRGEAPAEIAAFKVLVEPFFHADHGSNVFLQQAETVSAPAHTVGWIRDCGVGMVYTEELLCFRSSVRPGKRHLQDVERG